MMKVLLEAAHISMNFGIVRALDDVSFSVVPGEVHGLIGENGSGKSTLGGVISGMLKPSGGDMTFKGLPYRPGTMVEGQSLGIAMILQEMATVPGLSVAENIFLGKTKRFSKLGMVNTKKMFLEAKKALEENYCGHIDPKAPIDTLSFEDRKLVELVRALYDQPDLLILDETTTALSHTGREIMYRAMYALKSNGKAVVFISHDLGEMIEHCDRLTVLRDGRRIDCLEKDRMSPDTIRALMVGRTISGEYYRADTQAHVDGEILLQMKNAESIYTHPVSLQLHRGEILGLGGLSNSGMHELARMMFGLEPIISGSVEVSGNQIKDPLSAIRAGMGYVSKNRDQEALILSDNIRNNISAVSLDDFRKGLFLSGKKEKRFVQEQIDSLRIKCSSAEQVVSTLSGGNKQKVSFAKWMGKDAEIMILDCPTRGVDIGVKASMYELISQMREKGKGVVIVSEELPELIGMCDRILMVKSGRITKEVLRDQHPTEEMLIAYMI